MVVNQRPPVHGVLSKEESNWFDQILICYDQIIKIRLSSGIPCPMCHVFDPSPLTTSMDGPFSWLEWETWESILQEKCWDTNGANLYFSKRNGRETSPFKVLVSPKWPRTSLAAKVREAESSRIFNLQRQDRQSICHTMKDLPFDLEKLQSNGPIPELNANYELFTTISGKCISEIIHTVQTELVTFLRGKWMATLDLYNKWTTVEHVNNRK